MHKMAFVLQHIYMSLQTTVLVNCEMAIFIFKYNSNSSDKLETIWFTVRVRIVVSLGFGVLVSIMGVKIVPIIPRLSIRLDDVKLLLSRTMCRSKGSGPLFPRLFWSSVLIPGWLKAQHSTPKVLIETLWAKHSARHWWPETWQKPCLLPSSCSLPMDRERYKLYKLYWKEWVTAVFEIKVKGDLRPMMWLWISSV